MRVRSMRAVLILSLVVAVGGCASTRQALGLSGKGARSARAADNDAAETASARRAEVQAAKQLPAGLAGDREHRAYTTGTPQ